MKGGFALDGFTEYTLPTELTDYIPIPRGVLSLGLPSTAVLLYGALLDRGTLSRKNGYADGSGWIYVLYAIDNLAQTLQLGQRTVKTNLKVLSDAGLIVRRRECGNGPSQIFLRIPEGSKQEKNGPQEGKKTAPARGRKRPPNNLSKQQEKNNLYQPLEGESL